ncbi:hypothetical protein J6590_087036 [Homalodisca vitripennis]|nr:hypothetical protein J6590_087036 [Homalodisca vitripennis]
MIKEHGLLGENEYLTLKKEFGERMAPLQDMVGENKVIIIATIIYIFNCRFITMVIQYN